MKIIFAFFLINLLQSTILAEEHIRVINIELFKDENAYLPVKVGEKFTIEINGNPTTGYLWILEKGNKESLLTPLNLNENSSGEYFSHNTDDGRVGVGGIYHFKFQAGENSGEETLVFLNKRPWETNEHQNITRRSIHVKIVNPGKKDL